MTMQRRRRRGVDVATVDVGRRDALAVSQLPTLNSQPQLSIQLSTTTTTRILDITSWAYVDAHTAATALFATWLLSQLPDATRPRRPLQAGRRPFPRDGTPRVCLLRAVRTGTDRWQRRLLQRTRDSGGMPPAWSARCPPSTLSCRNGQTTSPSWADC